MSDPTFQKVTATVGVPVELGLEANPSTGFGWQLVSEACLGLGLIRLEELGATKTAVSKPGFVGAPVRWRWRVSPMQAGLVRLQFAYRRAWEHASPAKVHTFEIAIQG